MSHQYLLVFFISEVDNDSGSALSRARLIALGPRGETAATFQHIGLTEPEARFLNPSKGERDIGLTVHKHWHQRDCS